MNDISKNQSKMLKGIAIFFMLSLHLFNTTNYTDLYNPIITIKGLPITYFLSFIVMHVFQFIAFVLDTQHIF